MYKSFGSILPQSLQGTLIFYITLIVIFINVFFAIITLSRENIFFYKNGMNVTQFLGRILQEPTRDFLQTGSSQALDALFSNRKPFIGNIQITIYDENWWPKYGDPIRLPPGGFPHELGTNSVAFQPGVPGQSIREVFFAVSSGSNRLGSIGIGIPEFEFSGFNDSLYQVAFTAGINIFLGVALAVFIAQIILRPLASILEGLDAIKRGRYDQRVAVNGTGELATMGSMFNLMASSLQEKIREECDRNRKLDEKNQELWEIYELTKAMGFTLPLRQILEGFLEKAQTLSFSSYGKVLLYIPEGRRFETQVETSSFPEIAKKIYDDGLSNCLLTNSTVEVQGENHTFLFLPLLSGRAVQGVLFVGKHDRQVYSEHVKRFLEIIAPLGGTIIENACLYQHVVEMKDYVRSILDSVDSGLATLDEGGRLVTANAMFPHILGLSHLEENQSIRDILKPIKDISFVESFEAMVLKHSFDFRNPLQSPSQNRKIKNQPRFELPLHTTGEETRIIQLRVQPLISKVSILGTVLVIDNITSRKLIERRMFETEKWVSLGRIAASVAHEVRNPLVAIRSLVEVIGEELTGEMANHVKVVLGEVHRLNGVVEQLLSVSKPEKTEPREVGMGELLDELLLLIRHEAIRQKVTIKKIWPQAEIYARIDPEKLKQAFLNIIFNGIQAMGNGGNLTIGIQQTTSPFDSAGEDNLETPEGERSWVVIDINDEGDGIPLENLPRIFDPFFTTRPRGTGLGLAITKKIIDLHHGSISIHSQKGQGTSVRIAIPRYLKQLLKDEGQANI